MRKYIRPISILSVVIFAFASCVDKTHFGGFDNILDISYTGSPSVRYTPGCFSDMGSWMGFNIPQKEQWVNGFCGPFSIDSYQWIATAAVKACFEGKMEENFIPDSINYYPGGIYMSASSVSGTIAQHLFFVDASTILLSIKSKSDKRLLLSGENWLPGVHIDTISSNRVQIQTPEGETYLIQFPKEGILSLDHNNYQMLCSRKVKECYVVLSQVVSDALVDSVFRHQTRILEHPRKYIRRHQKRWQGYLDAVIRNDMPQAYNRIAVKSIVTLISNWRSARQGLIHDGVVPSHAVPYFVGFWAWDSWKHAVAVSRFIPDLAKEQVRAMFDYQTENGMVIDCIYTDSAANNYRDSKPPLAAWAVNEIYERTHDIVFLEELYPKLLRYYEWWYRERDHNKNGFCEFGSVDGTIEAAAWESGMDNAVRFDDASMLQNAPFAWSLNQESVDLNAFLALERDLLEKFSRILGKPFNFPDKKSALTAYFFDEETGFFYDRKIEDGQFIKEQGSEAYIPFWTRIATKEQFEKALPILVDENKFATYIPFPTVAADNPNFTSNGYWRGPIWLDQTYFAIKGLRNYGRDDLANQYTENVFDRLVGLKEAGAIYENYDTHTGKPLKAPHFSWSAAHLLLLYTEYVHL